MKNKYKKHKFKYKYLVAPILLVMSFTLSIVCASFNQTMYINGEAYARVNRDVRIMSIERDSVTNGGSSTYNPKYAESSVIMYDTLPALNSTVVYKIKIRNNTDNYINVYDVSNTVNNSISNADVTYEFDKTSLNSTYGSDLITPHTEQFVYVTIKYKTAVETLPEEPTNIAQLKFSFAPIYARELSYSNSTYTSCTTVQCALDDVKAILNNGSDLTPASKYTERFIKSHTNSNSYAEDDPDSNLRYIGANPNNYVRFNNELWRVIGLFDGKLKIVRNERLPYYLSWDTSKQSINKGRGINEWSQADLMKLLNPGYENNTDYVCVATYDSTNFICGTGSESDYSSGLVNNSLYWNAQSGVCYENRDDKKFNCNFSNSGLKDSISKAMIDDAVWHLTTHPSNSYNGLSSTNINAIDLYNTERDIYTAGYCITDDEAECNDDVTRTSSWTGKVALIYPSDYGYATSGGLTHDRQTCLSSRIVVNGSDSTWSSTYTECVTNNWLFYGDGKNFHALSPRRQYSSKSQVFDFKSTGDINKAYAGAGLYIRPTVYLKSTVTFTGNGHGTSTDPYTLYDTAASSS